jgi:hypothetical protein
LASNFVESAATLASNFVRLAANFVRLAANFVRLAANFVRLAANFVRLAANFYSTHHTQHVWIPLLSGWYDDAGEEQFRVTSQSS